MSNDILNINTIESYQNFISNLSDNDRRSINTVLNDGSSYIVRNDQIVANLNDNVRKYLLKLNT
ncbi:hypothetical protein KAFR_0H01140 [Kazachstania africana CBS 2517]|uniref:Uncharacterized protein n=1 Tax=Kazachstania africana (strain ATCC 22294 / BCRC 22015 / CBS 2517 / CECT 1963 / NBRC 1671 / NRRL Y-8276) TaxID=1071382 RepID=H2AYW8_KAZAF|nr:hypothetical protein KAFR_0H01140 [Kazachstania africana CBS 2517]CCF59524.1 hypothetical protein KAFR_0H01140 [Kazachstania africana CBS 2517]